VCDIEDGLIGIVGTLLGLLRGCVGAGVEGLAANGDLSAVGLVDDAVDLLEVVGVRDELVAGDDVLRGGVSALSERVRGSQCACGCCDCWIEDIP